MKLKSKLYRLIAATALTSVVAAGMSMSVSAAAGSCYTMLSTPIYTLEHAMTMAYYWDATGRHSYYNTLCDYAYVNSSDRINSDVIGFYGHANAGALQVNESTNLQVNTGTTSSSSGNYVGLGGKSFSNTLLAIFSGCETAGYQSGGNLCQVAVNRGANTSVGFSQTIYNGDSTKWNERFGSRLALGQTVDQAITYADGFSDYYDNTAQRSSTRYGTGTTRLTTAKSATDIPQEKLVNLNVPQITFDKTSTDFKSIAKALKYQIADLDSEKYIAVLSENDVNSFYVDFMESVDGYETSSGVSVYFENGKAVSVRDNRIDGNRPEKAPRSPSTSDIEATYKLAKQKLAELGYTVVSQSGKAVYDIIEDKFVYRVFSTYSSNGFLGGDVTDYEII